MGLSTEEIQTWVTMIRTQNWVNRQLTKDMLRYDDQRITEYDVLINLLRAPDPQYGLRMQDLTDRVIISNSGMTRVIDRLIEQNLVERRIYEDNRREVYVVLTDDGYAHAQKLAENHQQRIHDYVMQHITPDERQTLQAVFQRIAEANDILQPKITEADDTC